MTVAEGLALPSTRLSRREEQVLELAALGYKDKVVGEKLGITEKSVKCHLSNIRTKFNARNTAHAVYIRYAFDPVTTA